ncbi:helix-turn-helix domain-containing protein [Streptomyces phaeochromogenes]|uniref:helix-turn-helix domain-containing protein n=1 Tax=Streptomyces phaeochromogenes TaxID=1923 RepID=UPI001FE229EB|nr:helix-turn-helix domain-containing protein [Streptomyces phaeochromogenes]
MRCRPRARGGSARAHRRLRPPWAAAPATAAGHPVRGRRAGRVRGDRRGRRSTLRRPHRGPARRARARPRPDARDLARTRFAPLNRAGAPGTSVLFDTLRTWLTQQGSWDRTAAALQVHRNTVRHRLARVGELLDVDLKTHLPYLA